MTTERLNRATWRDRAAVTLLLVSTAALYLWNLSVNGVANPFYAASVWAGSVDWKAWFYAALDPSSFITIDKPPLAEWIMGLSARIFGFSSLSMLIPEALLGVGSVWFLYATATRLAGRRAGLLAGWALALTPVATLMFRYNNPDAAMLFFMVLAAYATVRTWDGPLIRWSAAAGAFLGLAFLAKTLQGVMIIPALLAFVGVVPQRTWKQKFGAALAAAFSMAVASGWYILVTILVPAQDRPYMAGSSNNTFLDLAFGYNGVGRVDPAATGGAMGHPVNHLTRLWTGEFGMEASWLFPAAFIGLAALAVHWLRARHQSRLAAGALLAGIWVFAVGTTISFMGGTTHEYYTLALVPGVALAAALGVEACLRTLDLRMSRMVLAVLFAVTGGWAFLLMRTNNPGWLPGLRWAILLASLAAAGVVVLSPWVSERMGEKLRGRMPTILRRAAGVGVAAALAAPLAYSINSDTVAHGGGSPAVAILKTTGAEKGGIAGPRTGLGETVERIRGHIGTRTAKGSTAEKPPVLGASLVSPALDALLRKNTSPWAAAMQMSAYASQVELSSLRPIMSIGGYWGTDPSPSLSEFQQDVSRHEIGYYLMNAAQAARGIPHLRNDEGPRSSLSFGAQIQVWVQTHFTGTRMGNAEVYDLSRSIR
jgi:4-amino-4-deoxy-L-arabinose transferase-like glycosyltransferase